MSLTNDLRFPQFLVIAYYADAVDGSLLESPLMEVFSTRSAALSFIMRCDESLRDASSFLSSGDILDGSYPVFRLYHLTRSKF